MNIAKYLIPSFFIILIVLIAIGAIRGCKFSINRQWAKIYLIDDFDSNQCRYRAWTISYSDGETYNEKGEWINLWRWPQYSHCDTLPFLKMIAECKEP